jgi:hypothetical protein
MGKVSLSGKIQEQIQIDNKPKLIPELSKKEWTSVLTAVFIIFSVGFGIGFFINTNRISDISDKLSVVDPLIELENDLNDKLISTSKQLDKIEDEDLYKVVMEKKGKKIESIKEQLKDIQTFRSNHINSINLYCNNKKDELKKKEILYHR